MRFSQYFSFTAAALALSVSILLTACSRDPHADSKAVFLNNWRTAHAAGDIEAQLALYYWDGVEETHRSFVRQSLVFEAEYPLAEASIEPLAPDDGYDYYFEGQRYLPNLEPAARLKLVFANEENLHSSLLLGMKDGRYLLLNPRVVLDEQQGE